MAHNKKKRTEDPPIEVENSVSEAEEVEHSDGGREEAEEEVEEKSDSDTDFVESSKNHKRKQRNKAVKKPNSKPKPTNKIIKKRRVSNHLERKWSDEDEIVVLEGVRDWKNRGWYPVLAVDEFGEEFTKSLRISIVSNRAVNEKIHALKKRFCKYLEKKNVDGVEPVFEDPHDYKMYLIMKDIWGVKEDPIRRRNVPIRWRNVKNGNGKGKGRNVKDKGEVLDNLPMLEIKQCVSEEGLKLLGEEKVMEFEIKWKQLQREERELSTKRMELVQETAQAVLAAVNSSKG